MNSKSNVINGKIYADKVLENLTAKIKRVVDQIGIRPQLAIVLVGEDPASVIYVRNKLKAASQVGIDAFKLSLSNSVTQEELIKEINKLNNDDRTSGIIVQLPLPSHINKNIILSTVMPEKDVDGFHPINVGRLHSGDSDSGFVPATPLGVLNLIKQVEPDLTGKNVAIVGRSNIVGKPLSALLMNENCTVTICHSKTKNLASFISKADIVISAMGKPKFLNESFFNAGSIVIDVGINRDPTLGKTVGDVDFEKVQPIVKYITPVPGGVGPMTIAFLLINSFKAFLKQNHLIKIENE